MDVGERLKHIWDACYFLIPADLAETRRKALRYSANSAGVVLEPNQQPKR